MGSTVFCSSFAMFYQRIYKFNRGQLTPINTPRSAPPLHGRTVCRFGASAHYFGQVVYGPRWCPCKVRAGRCDRTLRLSSGRRARMRMGIFSRTTPSEPIRTRQPNYVGPNDREPAKLTQRYFIFIFLMACVGSPSVSCVQEFSCSVLVQDRRGSKKSCRFASSRKNYCLHNRSSRHDPVVERIVPQHLDRRLQHLFHSALRQIIFLEKQQKAWQGCSEPGCSVLQCYATNLKKSR